MSKVPSITLPVGDYDRISQMSNYAILCIFRQQVLIARHRQVSELVPDDHTAYVVRHEPGHITITIHQDGKEVFHCRFVPSSDY